jgi:hypothetical protein
VAEDPCRLRIASLSRLFYRHFLKQSINELTGQNLGYLVPETGPCAKNWATEQGSSPNLGQPASQIRANAWPAQACTTTSSGYLVTA